MMYRHAPILRDRGISHNRSQDDLDIRDLDPQPLARNGMRARASTSDRGRAPFLRTLYAVADRPRTRTGYARGRRVRMRTDRVQLRASHLGACAHTAGECCQSRAYG